jgi:hypothetical protein
MRLAGALQKDLASRSRVYSGGRTYYQAESAQTDTATLDSTLQVYPTLGCIGRVIALMTVPSSPCENRLIFTLSLILNCCRQGESRFQIRIVRSGGCGHFI